MIFTVRSRQKPVFKLQDVKEFCAIANHIFYGSGELADDSYSLSTTVRINESNGLILKHNKDINDLPNILSDEAALALLTDYATQKSLTILTLEETYDTAALYGDYLYFSDNKWIDRNMVSHFAFDGSVYFENDLNRYLTVRKPVSLQIGMVKF